MKRTELGELSGPEFSDVHRRIFSSTFLFMFLCMR